MANTLTGLINEIHAALNMVSRETIGMIGSVSKDSSAEMAALNQPIRSAVAPAATVANVAAGATTVAGSDRAMSFVDLTITKSRYASFHITGEEGLSLGSVNYNTYIRDNMYEGMRAIVNEIESDLCGLYVWASRAVGTGGTTPFATANDLSDLSYLTEILNHNGAPAAGRFAVLNGLARANLWGKQPIQQRIDAAGEMSRRMGEVGMVDRFMVMESSQFPVHTAGMGTGYQINQGSGEAAGQTELTVDSGTGAAIAGDVFSPAGDAANYVVGSGSTTTQINIREPGLLQAAANNAALTRTASYTPSLAFSRDALHLACRAPADPMGGDIADDTMMVTDMHSGLTFQIKMYRQRRQVTYEIALAWGVAAVNPTHIALLMG